MAARGVFLNAGRDRWYMSELAANAFVRRRRMIALGLLVVAVIALLGVLALR